MKKNILYFLLILFAAALAVFLIVRYTALLGRAVESGSEGGGSVIAVIAIVTGLVFVLALIGYEKLKETYGGKEILVRFRE